MKPAAATWSVMLYVVEYWYTKRRKNRGTPVDRPGFTMDTNPEYIETHPSTDENPEAAPEDPLHGVTFAVQVTHGGRIQVRMPQPHVRLFVFQLS